MLTKTHICTHFFFVLLFVAELLGAKSAVISKSFKGYLYVLTDTDTETDTDMRDAV